MTRTDHVKETESPRHRRAYLTLDMRNNGSYPSVDNYRRVQQVNNNIRRGTRDDSSDLNMNVDRIECVVLLTINNVIGRHRLNVRTRSTVRVFNDVRH
jgi:hypothetical protein